MPRSETLRSRAIAGTAWGLFAYVGAQAIRLMSSVVLTRLLFPEAFGVMAIVWSYVTGLAMLTDAGLPAYLFQSSKIRDRDFADAIWSLGLVRAACVTAVAVAVAPAVATFYANPELCAMLQVASVAQFIVSASATKLVTAKRDLRQRELCVYNLVCQTISVGLTLVFAWHFRSPWSIIYGDVCTSVVRVIYSQVWFPGKANRWRWSSGVLREVRNFSTWIYVSSVMTFVGGQCDRLILAKLMPLDFVGLYGLAMNLTGLPLILVGQAISVVSPMIVELRHRGDGDMPEKVAEARRFLLKLSGVLVSAMCVGAPAFFGVLYDGRYQVAATIASVLTIGVWFSVLENSVTMIVPAFGDAKCTAMSSFARLVGSTMGGFAGYTVFGTYGFLVGFSFGAFAVYCATVLRIRDYGIRAGWSDLAYSLNVLGMSAAGWGGILAIELVLPGWRPVYLSATAALIVSGAGVIYCRRELTYLRRQWQSHSRPQSEPMVLEEEVATA